MAPLIREAVDEIEQVWDSEPDAPSALPDAVATLQAEVDGLREELLNNAETHVLPDNEGDDLPVSYEEYLTLKAAYPEGIPADHHAALRQLEFESEGRDKLSIEEWEQLKLWKDTAP